MNYFAYKNPHSVGKIGGEKKISLKEELRTAVIIYVVTFMKYVIFTELNSLISSFWMSIVRVPRRPFLFSYE